MDVKDVLTEAYGRIRDEVHAAVEGLSPEELNSRPSPDSNSISWLVWHLTRIQDDHVAEVAGLDQVWSAGGWEERFGLGLPRGDTGYGHDARQVARVRVDSGDLLLGYLDAVHERTLDYLSGLSARDVERIVDERWDPPVTLGVRLISVLADDLQHVGQAAYVRGLIQRAEAEATD